MKLEQEILIMFPSNRRAPVKFTLGENNLYYTEGIKKGFGWKYLKRFDIVEEVPTKATVEVQTELLSRQDAELERLRAKIAELESVSPDSSAKTEVVEEASVADKPAPKPRAKRKPPVKK